MTWGVLAAGLVAVGGTLLGAPWVAGAGAVTALALLGWLPAARDPAVPRPTRLALRAGLLLLALVAAGQAWRWASSPWRDFSPSSGVNVRTLLSDPTPYRWQLALAAGQILACVAFAVALARLPRKRRRRLLRGAPLVVVLSLLASGFLVLLPEDLDGLLGSFTNHAVAALIVLGGYAWFLVRQARRDGGVPIAAAAATVLAAQAWWAADTAWRSRPMPPPSDGMVVSVAVSVAAPGPDVTGAVSAAAGLAAAAALVLACARLSRREPE